MMLKFTNASEGFQGTPVYISKEWIVSVFERPKVDGGSLSTFIYGGPTGLSWEVSESLNEVINIIEGDK